MFYSSGTPCLGKVATIHWPSVAPKAGIIVSACCRETGNGRGCSIDDDVIIPLFPQVLRCQHIRRMKLLKCFWGIAGGRGTFQRAATVRASLSTARDAKTADANEQRNGR
jgi:hypothetical protein